MTACVKAYKEGWRAAGAVRWPGRDHRCAGMKRRRNALCSKRTVSGAELCSGLWSAFQPRTGCRKPGGCAVSVQPWKPTEQQEIGTDGFRKKYRKVEITVKVKPSVKKICEKCKIIKRHGHVMVICENPKHKQRQG